MKKIFFTVLLLICILTTGFAKSKMPIAVTSAFNQKFPNATNVKWDKENAHEYEAEFVWNSVNYSANFSDNGEWLETESPSSFNQLPEKVKAEFNKLHKGLKVKSVSKIDTSKRKTIFEIEIMKGVRIVELFYSEDGMETKE